METSFEQLHLRLKYLENWREVAIRPKPEECHDDDIDLLRKEIDNIAELSDRLLVVRKKLNSNLPPHELALDDLLTVKVSGIPKSGLGLFYDPVNNSDVIQINNAICYYTGHYHNNFSQKFLTDKSYLLNVAGDLFVDPGPLTSIKARYINDPLNHKVVNCKFVPDPLNYRCVVVATREIKANEEIFIDYGDYYWSQQNIAGTVYTPGKNKIISS